jgi:hypothetical protein
MPNFPRCDLGVVGDVDEKVHCDLSFPVSLGVLSGLMDEFSLRFLLSSKSFVAITAAALNADRSVFAVIAVIYPVVGAITVRASLNRGGFFG